MQTTLKYVFKKSIIYSVKNCLVYINRLTNRLLHMSFSHGLHGLLYNVQSKIEIMKTVSFIKYLIFTFSGCTKETHLHCNSG